MRISYTARILGSALEEIAPGVFLWLPGTAACEGTEVDGAPYDIEMTFGMTAEGVRPVSVTVTAPEGSPPLTSTILRAVPVQRLARAAILAGVQRGRRKRTSDGGTSTEILSPGLDDKDLELVRLRGPVPESLEVAAWVYNVAHLVGLPPARQVELTLGLPRTTASKWIKRARDMGLIGPEERNTDGKH